MALMGPRNMIILVIGLLPYDSGKTWTTIALAKAMKKRNLKVKIFKPIAGHSAWGQFRTVIESMKRGYLICEDALLYEEHLGEDNLTRTNPIDLLLTPPSLNEFKSCNDYIQNLADTLHQISLMRITKHRGVTEHYIVVENLKRTSDPLKRWIEKLALKLKPKPASIEDVVSILQDNEIDQELRRYLEEYKEKHDVVIVESFNNAALPFTSLLSFKLDAVLAVTPLHVLIMNPKLFAEKVKEKLKIMGLEGLEVDKIIEKPEDVSIIDLEPVPSIRDLSTLRCIDQIVDFMLKPP